MLISSLFLSACGSKSKAKDTTPPKFVSNNKVSVIENNKTVTTVKADDDSKLIFTITDGTDKAQFTITPAGVLTFKTAPDFEVPTDNNKNNTYFIAVTATDSAKNKTVQLITITVTDQDEIKPRFISANTVTVVEGSKMVMNVKASDNSNAVTYTLTGGEDQTKLSISSTGELTFKAIPSYASPVDADSDNHYIIQVTATDASKNDVSQSIEIMVIESILNLSGDYTVKKLGKAGSIATAVELGSSPKTLYVLFTNHHATATSTPSITHNKKVTIALKEQLSITSKASHQASVSHAPEHIRLFNANSHRLVRKNSEKYNSRAKRLTPKSAKTIVVNGSKETFVTDIYTNSAHPEYLKMKTKTDATARFVSENPIETTSGKKTLIIWVQDDSFGSDSLSSCAKNDGTTTQINCVTNSMVTALADKFLRAGGSNDTYDWVTNIYGKEWDNTNFSNLIENDNTINILLTDINEDRSLGGVIGFFYSKDNFKKEAVPGSNERLMFYIDSIMLASDGEGFGYWTKVIYATLAHEFTHMIEYYQKDILKNKTNDTWLSEMTAEATEYLTSYEVQHSSPRGIAYDEGSAGNPSNNRDRYPDFNRYNNTFSLSSFNNNIQDYSKVSAFGAFLVNNYGGPQVLRDIMQSDKVDENAVIEAVNNFNNTSTTTFGDILRDWGIAVLLSDKVMSGQSLTPRYNTGGFTNTNFNGITDANGTPVGNSTEYKIGSINFFNYSYCPKSRCTNISDFKHGPTVSSTIGIVKPHGNYFYKVGDNLTGKVTLNLNTDNNIEITLIAK